MLSLPLLMVLVLAQAPLQLYPYRTVDCHGVISCGDAARVWFYRDGRLVLPYDARQSMSRVVCR